MKKNNVRLIIFKSAFFIFLLFSIIFSVVFFLTNSEAEARTTIRNNAKWEIQYRYLNSEGNWNTIRSEKYTAEPKVINGTIHIGNTIIIPSSRYNIYIKRMQ